MSRIIYNAVMNCDGFIATTEGGSSGSRPPRLGMGTAGSLSLLRLGCVLLCGRTYKQSRTIAVSTARSR